MRRLGTVATTAETKKDYLAPRSGYAEWLADLGLLLCQEHSRLTVDYALRDVGKPVGVAGWRTKLIESLPRNLRGNLPTIREIEEELGEPKRTGASRSKGRPAKIESAKR